MKSCKTVYSKKKRKAWNRGARKKFSNEKKKKTFHLTSTSKFWC